MVTSADGRPLLGAVVRVNNADGSTTFLRSPGEPGSLAIARADAEGAWTVAGLRPGKYFVVATARGFLPGRSDLVTIDAEQVATGLRVELSPGGQSLTGEVTDVGEENSDAGTTCSMSRRANC